MLLIGFRNLCQRDMELQHFCLSLHMAIWHVKRTLCIKDRQPPVILVRCWALLGLKGFACFRV